MDEDGRIKFRWPLYLLLWGRIPYKKWSSPQSQKKNLKCSTWVQPQKWQNDLSSFPRQTIQHHSNSSLCPNNWCWRTWSWPVLWRPTPPSKTNTKKKRCSFPHRGLECKSSKSRDTRSNRQVWPWSKKWSRAKANSFLKNTTVTPNPFPTTQDTILHMEIIRWSIPKAD